ncbi:scavenger mRNA decapping enzyme [Hymenopellis radicata]|nr:scavenger mRNA decapping enzyme [Hymenopellis radicata]
MIDLSTFSCERILNQEPEKKRITLLGSFPPLNGSTERSCAIVRIEKTSFAPDFDLSSVVNIKPMQSTDIYSWFAGWLASSPEKRPQGDVKIDVICPATQDHINKYSPQRSLLVRETPELYSSVTKPYIDSFPPSRTKWVSKILDGESEREAILFNSPDFVILPDMKWDLHTVESLYLVAIARDASLRSLRDLRQEHLPLLRSIRAEAYKVVQNRWGLGPGSLRMWIHYQPSYYHFHVHIANASYEAPGFGMAVGQAHLLEDVISLLEISSNIFEKMTLTYGLGSNMVFTSLCWLPRKRSMQWINIESTSYSH